MFTLSSRSVRDFRDGRIQIKLKLTKQSIFRASTICSDAYLTMALYWPHHCAARCLWNVNQDPHWGWCNLRQPVYSSNCIHVVPFYPRRAQLVRDRVKTRTVHWYSTVSNTTRAIYGKTLSCWNVMAWLCVIACLLMYGIVRRSNVHRWQLKVSVYK